MRGYGIVNGSHVPDTRHLDAAAALARKRDVETRFGALRGDTSKLAEREALKLENAALDARLRELLEQGPGSARRAGARAHVGRPGALPARGEHCAGAGARDWKPLFQAIPELAEVAAARGSLSGSSSGKPPSRNREITNDSAQSGRLDSNQRPLDPQSSSLTTLRYAPMTTRKLIQPVASRSASIQSAAQLFPAPF